MSTAEVEINFVTNGISFGLTLLTIGRLWKVRKHFSVKPLQPLLLSSCILLVNLASIFYTWGNVLDLNWEHWFMPFVTLVSAMFAVLFVMILRYYQAFVQTENKIRIAAKLLDENHHAIKLHSLQQSTWIDRNLEKTSRICILGFLAFFQFSLPFYLFCALAEREVWESPTSNLDSDFLIFNLGVAACSCSIYNSVLLWLVIEVKKKQKEFNEGIRNITRTIGVSLVVELTALLVFYSSPLARISFESFQFMPIIVYHIPLSYLALATFMKTKNQKQRSEENSRRRTMTIDSSNGSDPKQAVGVKNELIALLDHSEGFEFMMQVAKMENSIENVLFYAAVSDWEALPAGSEAKIFRAREIVNVFCVESAAAAVNISYKARMEMETAIAAKDIREDFFESSKKEVINLMLWHTYVKIRNLPGVQEILSRQSQV